jgi:hypothetical protein
MKKFLVAQFMIILVIFMFNNVVMAQLLSWDFIAQIRSITGEQTLIPSGNIFNINDIIRGSFAYPENLRAMEPGPGSSENFFTGIPPGNFQVSDLTNRIDWDYYTIHWYYPNPVDVQAYVATINNENSGSIYYYETQSIFFNGSGIKFTEDRVISNWHTLGLSPNAHLSYNFRISYHDYNLNTGSSCEINADITSIQLSQPVPEPSSYLLLLLGVLGLVGYSWRKAQK